MSKDGKLRLLRKNKGTVIKEKHVERSTVSPDGGEVVLKVPLDDEGDLLVTRRLAKILFNKDWGRK